MSMRHEVQIKKLQEEVERLGKNLDDLLGAVEALTIQLQAQPKQAPKKAAKAH